MIGILCALDAEVSKFYELIENAEVTELYGFKFAAGKLEGKDVVIAKCGVGKVNAAICAQTMIMTYAPELIINSGVAGSLSAELGICDIAVGSSVVEHDIDTTDFGEPYGLVPTINKVDLPCDENVCEIICKAAEVLGIKAVPVRIASGDQFISNAEKKKWLVKTFDAKACEMESGAIAHVCCIAGVKCAVIRAISDSTDGEHSMEFSKFLTVAADNSIKVLLETLKHI